MATSPPPTPLTADQIGARLAGFDPARMGVEVVLTSHGNHYYVTDANVVSGGPDRDPVLVLSVVHRNNYLDRRT